MMCLQQVSARGDSLCRSIYPRKSSRVPNVGCGKTDTAASMTNPLSSLVVEKKNTTTFNKKIDQLSRGTPYHEVRVDRVGAGCPFCCGTIDGLFPDAVCDTVSVFAATVACCTESCCLFWSLCLRPKAIAPPLMTTATAAIVRRIDFFISLFLIFLVHSCYGCLAGKFSLISGTD